MSRLTIRHLRYFDSLAKTGHFGRAADDCAVSQPALSMQIKELEDIIGSPLFERRPRALTMTAFGERFAERARSILRDVDELEDFGRNSNDQLIGRLRIGVIPTIAPYLLPQLIRDLALHFPDLEPAPRETVTPRLLNELTEGKLDCAIVALPVSETSLCEEPLFKENFVLVRPLSEADKPAPDPESLSKMRLLLLEEGHCFRDQALSFCDISATKPRELLDGSSLSTLVQMVGAGIGVTLIPEMAVRVETRSAPVAVTSFKDPQPSRTVGMVWRKTSPLASQMRRIASIVRTGVATKPVAPQADPNNNA